MGRMKLIFFLACAFALFGCDGNKTVKSFGPEFDTEREKIGLRPIGLDSVLTNRHEYIFPTWVNPVRQRKGNPRIAHWVSKQLEIRNRVLLSETDTYSSGREYEVPEKGMREEQLIIRYDYVKAKAGENPWWCRIFWGPHQGEFSLQQAESILHEWNISRVR